MEVGPIKRARAMPPPPLSERLEALRGHGRVFLWLAPGAEELPLRRLLEAYGCTMFKAEKNIRRTWAWDICITNRAGDKVKKNATLKQRLSDVYALGQLQDLVGSVGLVKESARAVAALARQTAVLCKEEAEGLLFEMYLTTRLAQIAIQTGLPVLRRDGKYVYALTRAGGSLRIDCVEGEGRMLAKTAMGFGGALSPDLVIGRPSLRVEVKSCPEAGMGRAPKEDQFQKDIDRILAGEADVWIAAVAGHARPLVERLIKPLAAWAHIAVASPVAGAGGPRHVFVGVAEVHLLSRLAAKSSRQWDVHGLTP